MARPLTDETILILAETPRCVFGDRASLPHRGGRAGVGEAGREPSEGPNSKDLMIDFGHHPNAGCSLSCAVMAVTFRTSLRVNWTM